MRKPVTMLVALAGLVDVTTPSLTAQKKEDTPKKTTAKPAAPTTQSQSEPIQNNQGHAGIHRHFIAEQPEAA